MEFFSFYTHDWHKPRDRLRLFGVTYHNRRVTMIPVVLGLIFFVKEQFDDGEHSRRRSGMPP